MSDIRFPDAFEGRMQSDLGEEWSAFSDAHAGDAPVSIRVNPSKPAIVTRANPIPWAPTGYYLAERPSFTSDPTFHAGAYYVQEASSMFLEQAFQQCVDRERSLNVLDLCAAPGGKSTHLLSLMNRDSFLVANEVIRSRAAVLAENIQKWGYDNVVVTNNDPEDFKRLQGFFDVVLVDAPCSGEGLFRKDAEAMNAWSTENVALCSRRQRRILHDIWPSLKPGGILIYSTCTYNEAENEENLLWLAQQQQGESVRLTVDPTWNIQEVATQSIYGYRFFPHRVKGEGFFLSVIRKSGERDVHRSKRHAVLTRASKKITEQLASWVLRPEEKLFLQRNDLIQSFPEDKASELDFLMKNLHIITAGTFLATVKHEKLIPEHASALSIDLNKENFPTLTVDLEQALQFLRKEPMPFTSLPRGFTLVRYNGFPLGWVNVLDNRMNNMYPQAWRIRMK